MFGRRSEMKFNPITYEQWLAKNPDIEEEEIEEVCPECNGKGIIECDYCGREDDCDGCAGKDKKKINKAEELYREQIQKEKKLFDKYQEMQKY
jgi:DnaJ-class molecular chaperone